MRQFVPGLVLFTAAVAACGGSSIAGAGVGGDAGAAGVPDAGLDGRGRGPTCLQRRATFPAIYVSTPCPGCVDPQLFVPMPGSYDGPAEIVEADSTHLAIQPPAGSATGDFPELDVTWHGSSPLAVIPPAGSTAWLTIRAPEPYYSYNFLLPYLFLALRKSQGGELYFAYNMDTDETFATGYFSTPAAMGATLSVADTCSFDVPDGCFENQRNTLLALTFDGDTSITLGGGQSGTLWAEGRQYGVFVDMAERDEGGAYTHDGWCPRGMYLDFFMMEVADGVDACRQNGDPCQVCCGKYSYPDDSLYPILHDCACAASGPCATACEQQGLTSFCSGGGSIDKDCRDCLDGIALSPPAACASAMAACASDSACSAYASCMKSCTAG